MDGHTTKGKSVFLPQMAKMVEWLKNAEEGNEVYIFYLSIIYLVQCINLDVGLNCHFLWNKAILSTYVVINS